MSGFVIDLEVEKSHHVGAMKELSELQDYVLEQHDFEFSKALK